MRVAVRVDIRLRNMFALVPKTSTSSDILFAEIGSITITDRFFVTVCARPPILTYLAFVHLRYSRRICTHTVQLEAGGEEDCNRVREPVSEGRGRLHTGGASAAAAERRHHAASGGARHL